METASATSSLLTDLSKSEDLYNAQEFVHIVDAFTTERESAMLSCDIGKRWKMHLTDFSIEAYLSSCSCGLHDSLNTTE